MSDFDPKTFLNTPIYAFDFQFMIGDLGDFLDFSERNIEWQHRRELRSISRQMEVDDLPIGYREHQEQIVNHRFCVSLPLRVRYSAVLTLTTSVEWAIKLLHSGGRAPVAEKPGMNDTVNILQALSARAGLCVQPAIDDYKALVNVRNCIIHSAGIVETYRFKESLPADIDRLHGFGIANSHFMGDQVSIDRHALAPYIGEMGKLVVDLHRMMYENGLLQTDPY